MIKLLPCPICSRRRDLILQSREHKDRPDCNWTASIICLECELKLVSSGFDWTEEESKDNVIRKWNNRKSNDSRAKWFVPRK